MKITVYSLTIDWHNSCTETSVFATEAEFLACLKTIMEDRLADGDDWDDEENKEAIATIRADLAAGNIREAWDVFTDYESGVKHPDDCFWWEEHELDVVEPLHPEEAPDPAE